MKTTAILLFLILIPVDAMLLRAQHSHAGPRQQVLIVLRQSEGSIGQRLAALPPATTVPEEVRVAAERERAALAKAQQESLAGRLTAVGATGVFRYGDLNMMRAEVSHEGLAALQADPAVLSVTPVGDSKPVAPAMTPAPVTPPVVQVPQMASATPAFLPSMPTPGLGTMPGQFMAQQPGLMGQQPGLMGMGGGGTMSSLLMATSQMGASTSMMMPRASGIMVLLAGGAQIASILASSRRHACTISLDAPAMKPFPATGGHSVFLVKAGPTCLWQAQSNADWLQIEMDGPMAGSGMVRYTVSPSSVANRTGNITVVGISKTTLRGAASVSVAQGQ